MSKEIIVQLTKPSTKRYVLRFNGLTIEPLLPNYNKKLEWRTLRGAMSFLMEHDFRYKGCLIDKNEITAEEL